MYIIFSHYLFTAGQSQFPTFSTSLSDVSVLYSVVADFNQRFLAPPALEQIWLPWPVALSLL